ncbi:MAG TPA: porin family protein [Burkholderiales bacterium]
MRHLHKIFGFTLITIVQAVPACGADAAGLALHPASRLEIAQAPVSEPVSEPVSATVSATGPPLADLLARAKSLSSSRKFLDAYELLDAAEDTYIGVIEFDYALGRAALDAGRPDKATLALSRVLALDPGHAGASIDMGRAYLALGNYDQARAKFETLLSLDPPPAVRAQLQAYLGQARAGGQDRSAKPVGRLDYGYLAAVVGKSSNVNQSPGQPLVFIPAFGATYQLSNQNVKKADGYTGVMGGADVSLPLNDTYSLLVGGEFAERRNNHESAFDLAGLGVRVGIAAATQEQLLRLRLLVGREYLGNSPNRDLNGLGLDYFRSLGANAQFLAFAQGGRLRYVQEGLNIFDADFNMLGIGASRTIARDSTAFVTISTGQLNDVGGNASGDRRSLRLRLGADVAILPRLRLMGNAAWERGQYNRIDPSFLTERLDFFNNFELALQYGLTQRTSLRLSLAQVDQRSNIPIYAYDRTERWLSLLYEFPK